MEEELRISLVDARKLVGAASGDAALLYLYLTAGGTLEQAAANLRLTQSCVDTAAASLRQLGLLESSPRYLQPGERPVYTEKDVLREMETGKSFPLLVGEAQREFGRVLSTEELKILLSMRDYLGLSEEIMSVLIHFCMERSRARGNLRAPSLRSIEKEAYHWADNGIDTLEQAAAYVQNQLQAQEKIAQVKAMLQLSSRRLTAAEENYIRSWLQMGFDLPEIQLAYERTCLNTGGLKWQYMNKILQNWDSKNLHSLAGIQASDRPAPTSAAAASAAPSAIGKAAIARLLQEETQHTKPQ